MEIFERAKMTTSIQIPVWLAKEIKDSGMTYPGAMVAGWNAIQAQKEASQQIANLRLEVKEYRENMTKYRDRWLQSIDEKGGVKNV